jgi:ABC-type multidrug transport system fused ATPase/permease subunit
VLSASFAFNLLMGRQWPPSNADVKEAEQVCGELGLGPLLARMPGGLWQMVGETGWQLSQGERSRLFLARALLSGADVVILDESFAALDPGTLEQAMACALRRARTLVVVAHP